MICTPPRMALFWLCLIYASASPLATVHHIQGRDSNCYVQAFSGTNCDGAVGSILTVPPEGLCVSVGTNPGATHPQHQHSVRLSGGGCTSPMYVRAFSKVGCGPQNGGKSLSNWNQGEGCFGINAKGLTASLGIQYEYPPSIP